MNEGNFGVDDCRRSERLLSISAFSREEVQRLTSVGGSHRRSSPRDNYRKLSVDSAHLKKCILLGVCRYACRVHSAQKTQNLPQFTTVDFALSAQIGRRGSLGVWRTALMTDDRRMKNAMDSEQTHRPRLRNQRQSAFCHIRKEEKHREATTPEVLGVRLTLQPGRKLHLDRVKLRKPDEIYTIS